jgi:hypothetical protein
MTLPELQRILVNFNAGKTIGPFNQALTVFQCDQCGRHFATLKEAEDCEWLDKIDESS